VPDDIPLLVSWLRDHGYDTFGIPGPSRMGSMWGYDRGFDEYYEAYSDDHPSYTSFEVVRKVLSEPRLRRLLLKDFGRTVTKGRDSLTSFKFDLLADRVEHDLEPPFFGMVNTTVVHSPYDPPRPFKERATPELKRPRWFFLEYLLDTEEQLQRDDVRPERYTTPKPSTGWPAP